MRKFAFAAAMFSSAVALPALAASSNTSSTAPNQSTQNPAQIEQDLRQDLSKAGFTDIRIAPGSFMVHAKDSRGNPTEMMVSPNSLTEVTAINPSSSQSSTNGSQNAMKGGSSTKQ